MSRQPGKGVGRVAVLFAAALGVTGGGALRACLWDSDTLATEAKGVPDVVRAITGRFERNPPLYYEIRLKIAAGRVAARSDDFDAYDDAGVACDRLGRGDEAIAWMEKKRERLDEAEARGRDVARHRYRYLANVGTFWAHRWFRAGVDRTRIVELQVARDFIAEAIRLNPQAHFGREPYQLKVLDWVISPPPLDSRPYADLPTFVDFHPGRDDPHAAVEALSGLIMLGNAWESVDVFNALVRALDADGERTSVAMLARWRCLELVDQGKGSLVPVAPKGAALRDRIARPFSEPQQGKLLEYLYRRLRDEADAWHKSRTDFMAGRLGRGLHPDKDADFWSGYHEPAPPTVLAEAAQQVEYGRSVPDVSVARHLRPWLGFGERVLEVGAVAAGLAFLNRARRRRHLARGFRPVPRKPQGLQLG
jgi:hypothetical protein